MVLTKRTATQKYWNRLCSQCIAQAQTFDELAGSDHDNSNLQWHSFITKYPYFYTCLCMLYSNKNGFLNSITPLIKSTA